MSPAEITNQPTRVSLEQFPLRKGDVLVGRVLQRKGPFRYLVRIGGQLTEVNSRLELSDGQLLVLEFKEGSPRIHLKLISTLQHLQTGSQMKQLARKFGFPTDAFSLDFLRLSFQLGVVVRREYLKQLKSLYHRWDRHRKISAEVFLLPYFVQSSVFSHLAVTEPFFLLKWYWGLKDADARASRQPSDAEASEEPASSLFESLREGLQPLQKGSLFDRFLHSAVWRHFRMQCSGRESCRRSSFYQDGMRFVEEQIVRYRTGRWAMFPVEVNQESGFLFLKQSNTAGSSGIRFYFEVDHPVWQEIQVRGELKGTEISLVFYNGHKVFGREVDSHKINLKEKLMRIGFQRVNLSHITGIRMGQGLRQLLNYSVSTVDKVA